MAEVLSRANGSWSECTVDAYTSVFEPDIMLPSQLLSPDEDGVGGGERQLMAAILSDGIEAYITACLKLNTVGVEKVDRKRSGVDALEWIETKDYSYVFSFDNVCTSLGIDPDYLRTGLVKYVRSAIDRSHVESESHTWKRIRRPRKH